MGLVWVIFADPELVLGLGRLSKARCSGVSGGICFALFGYIWFFGTRVGVSGTVARSRVKKTRKLFYGGRWSPRISSSHLQGQETQVKLAGTGSSSSAISESGRGGGGDGGPPSPLSPLQRQKPLRKMGGKNPCCPAPLTRPQGSPPLPWAVPIPARPSLRSKLVPGPDSRVPAP